MATDLEEGGKAITIKGQDLDAHAEHHEKGDTLVDQAIGGTENEHALGTLEATRIYWKAVVLTILLTLTIIMRGYDASVATSFFGLPAFRDRYGYNVPGHGKQIPAAWQSALGIATTVGQVFGTFAVTYPMDRWGRRKTLACCLVLTSAIIPMQAFAPSIQVLTAGEYIGGLVLGSYQVLIPTYSAELLPTVLRPFLAGYINANYNIGGLLIAGIVASFDNWTTQWAYRIPFTLQWIWPAIVLTVLLVTPESPWWLVRKGRLDAAQRSLNRLSTQHPKVDIEKTVAMMQKTILYEDKIGTGGSIIDCFKGVNRRRTEILIMIFFSQDFSLSPVNQAYFYEQLNISTDKAFRMNIGGTAISTFFSIMSAFSLRFFGRRSTFTTGIGLLSLVQFLVGFLQLPPNYNKNPSFSIGQISLLYIAGAIYNLSIGPLTYSILTEVPSIQLRSQSVAIATASDAVWGIITNFITPYLINPGEANARGKVDFLWGGISFFSCLWCIFRLPETKHRTFEEIDYLFENKVRTRQFKNYVINEEALRDDLKE